MTSKSGNELACTYDEFKKMGAEFIKAAPTMNSDELQNAHKCLTIGYLNMCEQKWEGSAETLFTMAFKAFMAREKELIFAGLSLQP